MQNYALIKNGIVENVVVLGEDSDWAPPEGYEVALAGVAGIGWSYVGGEYLAPPPPDLPPPTTEQLATKARTDRDTKLASTSWLVERHREEQETGATTLTSEQYADLLAYRQALRDVPQQAGFPESIQWPAIPEF